MPKPWTPEEDDVIRRRYRRSGAAKVAKLLQRSLSSVTGRARRLRVFSHRRWTAADDERLALLWDTATPIDRIAKALGRSRQTVYWRGRKLGLTAGCPEGHEYISAAARRTGFNVCQLRRVLVAHEVPVKQALARPGRDRETDRTYGVVETELVNEAVSAWCAREPVEAAARRIGTTPDKLRRRLRAAGVEDQRQNRKQHWRVSGEDLEKAVDPPRRLPARGAGGKFCGPSKEPLHVVTRGADSPSTER